MTARMLARFLFAAFFLPTCSVSGQTKSAGPTQHGQEAPAIPDWKPAILPADAVAYGAALHQQAPPRIKAWCEEFAHKEMPKHRIDPRETMALVDKQFPQNSNEARDAAIYLVFYLSYVDEDANQQRLAGEIRRMDDEARDIVLRMQAITEQENNRLASARRTPSQQEMLRNEAKIRQMDEKLHEMSERRKQKAKELNTARKRTDGYLKVLDVTHKRMNGIEPSILREFQ
jgi:hypothetical protein